MLASASTPVPAQEPESVALAKQLTSLLEQMKLDSVAARDTQADGFVAALYFPGQLMVVGARYSVPVLLNDRLAKKEFKEVYNDLNGAPVAGSKCFVMDLGADGLRAKRDEGRLDTFESAGKTWAFDGDWKAQNMSEQEYGKAYGDAESRYCKMLQALIAQLKKISS